MHRILYLCFVALLFVPNGAWPQGDPLGPEFRVNTYTTDHQGRPAIASDASSNFVVVWASVGQDGLFGGVFGQRYASTGEPLGPEFRVNTYTTGRQIHPAVASDAAGNFVVIWESYRQDGSHWRVDGQRYAKSGAALGPEFRVNTYMMMTAPRPALSADSTGSFVVVWARYAQNGSKYNVFGQRYASTGEPLGPEFRVNTYTTGFQVHPALASDASGNFVVIWHSYFGNDGVFGQRYASTGEPLGPEFRVNTYTTGRKIHPAVASDSFGNVVVVWESYSQDGSRWGVFGQRYASTGEPLGPEFRVNTFTTDYQQEPAVASDSSGNFVVVWSNSHTRDEDVFGQRYLSTGEPFGPEFRVNTNTPSVQATPAVASDASGNFVVVWNSLGQEHLVDYGVFGQRYSQIVPVELMHFRVE